MRASPVFELVSGGRDADPDVTAVEVEAVDFAPMLPSGFDGLRVEVQCVMDSVLVFEEDAVVE